VPEQFSGYRDHQCESNQRCLMLRGRIEMLEWRWSSAPPNLCWWQVAGAILNHRPGCVCQAIASCDSSGLDLERAADRLHRWHARLVLLPRSNGRLWSFLSASNRVRGSRPDIDQSRLSSRPVFQRSVYPRSLMSPRRPSLTLGTGSNSATSATCQCTPPMSGHRGEADLTRVYRLLPRLLHNVALI
jgi:hypothetical protein